MKSGKNNKTLKLVGATSVTLFSLVSVFAATWAWFSMNKDVDGSGMDLKVTSSSGRLSKIYFHNYDDSDAEDNILSFSKTPFATYQYDWESNTTSIVGTVDNNKWGMGTYQSIDKDHPMLMIVEYDNDYVSSATGDMVVRGVTPVGGEDLVQHYPDDNEELDPIYTTNGGFLGARKDDGSPFYNINASNVANLLQSETNPGGILIKQQNGTDYYALSSVAYFRNRAFSDSQFTTFKNSSSTLDFATNTLTIGEPFTTIKNDSDRYLFNQEPCLFKSSGSGTIKYIAITIEYSVDAIGYIYSTYLGDSGLNHYDSILDFACDWSLEIY